MGRGSAGLLIPTHGLLSGSNLLVGLGGGLHLFFFFRSSSSSESEEDSESEL